MSVFDEILSELRSSDPYDAKLAEKAAAELAELLEYKKLYGEVANLLNSANAKLHAIGQLASRESGLTQRAADFSVREALPLNQHIQSDGGAFFVHWSCSGCLPDDYDSSESCHHCGKPRTVKSESR